MLIITLYGGLVSQIRAFYLGYKLTEKFKDRLVLDLSNYYTGYYQPYLLDMLSIPDYEKIMLKGNNIYKAKKIVEIFESKVDILECGNDLIEAYGKYDVNHIYWIKNDSCEYDSFCMKYKEFFFRYIGKDKLTCRFFAMMDCLDISMRGKELFKSIKESESVGIHIRLRDFVTIGWANSIDFDFYLAAIEWLRENVLTPQFYVFSDDIVSAKKILGIADDIVYVEHGNEKSNDVEDLLLLGYCKHKILTKKSTYGLFSSTIGQNKWNLDGYTLIIKNMTLDGRTKNFEYVEQNYNKNIGCHQNRDLSNCVLLSKDDIDILKNKFKYRSNNSIDMSSDTETFCQCEKHVKFLFLTFQVYDSMQLTGMQRFARYISNQGNEVFFVGNHLEYNQDCDDDNSIEWTLDHKIRAKDLNGCSQNFFLYPYIQLNKKNSYIKFIEYLIDKYGKNFVVIIRKADVLKECKKKYNNLRYIFLDYSDPFDVELKNKPDKLELDFLYRNSDIVITYDYSIYSKWYNKLNKKIYFINIEKLFPSCIETKNVRYNSDTLIGYEDNLWRAIYDVLVEKGFDL